MVKYSIKIKENGDLFEALRKKNRRLKHFRELFYFSLLMRITIGF